MIEEARQQVPTNTAQNEENNHSPQRATCTLSDMVYSHLFKSPKASTTSVHGKRRSPLTPGRVTPLREYNERGEGLSWPITDYDQIQGMSQGDYEPIDCMYLPDEAPFDHDQSHTPTQGACIFQEAPTTPIHPKDAPLHGTRWKIPPLVYKRRHSSKH